MLNVVRIASAFFDQVLCLGGRSSPFGSTLPSCRQASSAAIRVGDKVYVSGATGTASDGTLPRDFVAQATNAKDAVAKELQLAGASMNDVYRCTIALTDMTNWDAFNTVYVKYFKPDRFPVRMSFGVTSLGGAAVEVQCEASLEK